MIISYMFFIVLYPFLLVLLKSPVRTKFNFPYFALVVISSILNFALIITNAYIDQFLCATLVLQCTIKVGPERHVVGDTFILDE